MINFHIVIPGLGISLVNHIYTLSELLLCLSFPYPYISQSFANYDGSLSEWVDFIHIITDCILMSVSLIDLEVDLSPSQKAAYNVFLKERAHCFNKQLTTLLPLFLLSLLLQLFSETILAANSKQKVSSFTVKMAVSFLGKA